MLPEKVSKARSLLVLRQPFFATLLLGTPTYVDATLNPPTMATNGTAILMHPEFIESCSVAEIMGVLCHEVMHIAMMHPWRRGSRDPRRANIAMDYAINGIIEEAGLTLPENRLRKREFDGLSFEEIYTKLPATSDDDDGDGDGAPLDEVRDAKGDTAQQQQSEAEMRIRVVQAATIAKAQGKLPSSLAKLVEEVLAPVVDWRAELRRYMTAVQKTDQSWARPQRRMLGLGMYLPSFHTPGMGKVVVAIDTSGSVVEQAKEFLSEVQAICEDCRPEEIVVIQCDAVVQRVDTYQPGDPINSAIAGGGGTSFRPPFEWCDKEGVTPAVLVYLTDLEGQFPHDPGYPVIWAATTKHDVPFGDVIRM